MKEYELRLKAAEEWVKKERQGSKERVAEVSTLLFCFLLFRFSVPPW